MNEILILGAGYTGMAATAGLAGRLKGRDDVHITLVNPQARFTERLRLHQTASGQTLADLQIPDQLDGTGVDFVRGWVTGIDADARTVRIDDAYTLRYDTLVYALGSVADTEAVPGVDEFAYTLNSAQDAALLAEQLDRLADGTVVVAGGGLTGIESAADLELVGPLWVAVHHQHAESMPRLAPYVSDDETWRVRRALYEELLARADTLLLLAFVDDTAVGYGLTHVLPVDETWIPDTWVTGARIGEIESLSVLPQYRGSGLGSELLDRSSSTYTQPASRI